MNINIPPIVKNKYFRQSFGNSKETKNINKKPQIFGKNRVKDVAPCVIGGIMLLGCYDVFTNSGSFESNNNNDINVEYAHVKKITKDSLMKPAYVLKSKLGKNNDFIEGIKFDIINDFSEANKNDEFKKFLSECMSGNDYKGVSFYSDEKLTKRVAIQEIAHNNTINGIDYLDMRHSLMHELGHQFDNFFGHNHSDELAKKRDLILMSYNSPYQVDISNSQVKNIMDEYDNNCSLSSKKGFRIALIKDLNNLRKNKEYYKYIDNLCYYIDDIDLSTDMPEYKSKKLTKTASEIYASLFSYAMGENDGDKEIFKLCFSNSYNVVKRDIKANLGIELPKD